MTVHRLVPLLELLCRLLEAAHPPLPSTAGIGAEVVNPLEYFVEEGAHVWIHDSPGALKTGEVGVWLRRIQPLEAPNRWLWYQVVGVARCGGAGELEKGIRGPSDRLSIGRVI